MFTLKPYTSKYQKGTDMCSGANEALPLYDTIICVVVSGNPRRDVKNLEKRTSMDRPGMHGTVHSIVVSTLALINKVHQHQAQLLLRWVTVSRFNSPCGPFISVCNQPPRSTQPGHPFVGRRNEYQPEGGDALWLGSKGKYGSGVRGR